MLCQSQAFPTEKIQILSGLVENQKIKKSQKKSSFLF